MIDPSHPSCSNCMVDDIGGRDCSIIKEAYCPGNQCSGHGDCNLGFCKCHKGYYGLDCSRRVGSDQGPAPESDAGVGGAVGRKPWLKTPGLGLVPIAAVETPPIPKCTDPPCDKPTRKRPLIYVYDSPPPYTTRMLQYRLVWESCVWRHFRDQNETDTNDWIYGIETYFHEMLLMSPHRTFDPEEADFFFVPIYVTCYFWPIIGWADHPWWHAPSGYIRSVKSERKPLPLY